MATNPWEMDWSQGPVYGAPDPQAAYRDEDQALQRRGDARADISQQLAIEAANRSAAAEARAQEAANRTALEWQASHNPDGTPKVSGKALPDSAAKRIEGGVGQYSALSGALSGFQDDYAGNTVTGNLENTLQGVYSGFGTEGQRNWWANFRATDNVIRNELFGAALTPQEKASYESTTIDPSLDPKIVRENLSKRVDILRGALDRQRRFMVSNGYNEDAVNILYEPVRAMEQLNAVAQDAAPQSPPARMAQDPRDLGAVPGAGGGPTEALVTDGQTTAVNSVGQGIANEYRERLAAGQTGEELVTYLRSAGIENPDTLRQAAQQAAYRRRFPNVPIEQYDIRSFESVPLSAADNAINQAAQSSVGAYALGAADTLTAGNLDSLVGMTGGNAERARQGMAQVSENNPVATTVGQVSGGVLTALGGEAALARAGIAPGIARSAAADTAFGGAYGAGSTDIGANGAPATFSDRAIGAAQGGATSALASFAGQGAANAFARGVAPSGGELNALYAAGVRPSVGQRAAAMETSGGLRGAVGRAVSSAEQKLQSVPVLGSAIRGTREAARDEFQIGAFNEALKEVGESLPRGMRPGADPNKYAQDTFNRVYAQARSGMVMRPDADFIADIGNITAPISELGPQATAKLKAVLDNNVYNRFVGGQISGDRYKRVISDLGKRAASFSKGSSAEDQLLASVINDLKFSIENAARRHSDPDSVALLDAADAGYAKLVRIEDAARRRGGDPGTFTPANLDAAVQNTSGGVRSREYLRGEALMQDYATQGRALSDTVPNSGTTDRLLATAGLAGGVALSPKALALFGGLLGAYAPGGRNVVRSAIAPAGPRQRAISAQLRKRARLIGATSAAAASQGTSGGQ